MPNFLTNFSLFGNHKKSELENINTSTTTQLSETITVGKPLSKKEKREWNDRWEIRNTSLQILKMKVFERMGENDDVKRALLSLSDEDMVFLRGFPIGWNFFMDYDTGCSYDTLLEQTDRKNPKDVKVFIEKLRGILGSLDLLHDAWKNPENYLLVVNSERTLEVKQRFIKDFLSLSYNKTGGVLGGFMLPSDHGLKMFINNQELMNTLQILNESDRKKWNRTLVNMDINNEFGKFADNNEFGRLVKLLSTRSLSSLNKHTVDQMYKFFFDVNESNIEEKLLLIREYFEKKVSLDKKIVEANTLIEKELPDDYIEIIGKKD